MLYDILFALCGFPGDLIVDTGSYFAVAPGSALSSSELAALQPLLATAYAYHRLDQFCQTESMRRSSSLYTPAIALGVSDVLTRYRADVASCESRILLDPILPLSTLAHALSEWKHVLPAVLDITESCSRDNSHSGRVLSTLFDASKSGNPAVRTAMMQLLTHALRVFFRQLTSWCVHSILYSDEFLVHEDSSSSSSTASAAGAGGSGNNNSVIHKSHVDAADNSAKAADLESFWQTRFTVDINCIPSFMTVSCAEKVLFIGKAMQILQLHAKKRRPQQKKEGRDVLHLQKEQQRSVASSPAHRLLLPSPSSSALFASSPSMAAAAASLAGIVASSSVLSPSAAPPLEDDELRSCRTTFSNAFASLCDTFASDGIVPATLHTLIETFRATAANHLWRLVVVEGKLSEHLNSFREYFLLARGDLYQCLVEETRHLFAPDAPPVANPQAEMHAAWARAASRAGVSSEDDPFFGLLSLDVTLLTAKNDKSAGATTAANTAPRASEICAQLASNITSPPLSLNVSVPGPLALFFSRDRLSTYSRLFRFLFALKRVQCELQDAWATLMAKNEKVVKATDGKEGKTTTSKLLGTITTRGKSRGSQSQNPWWRLRHSMGFLVDNLQFYLHVDVLDVQFAKLVKSITGAQEGDFEALQRAHAQFTADVSEQCFFSTPVVERVLEDLCGKVLSFCTLLKNKDKDEKELDAEVLALSQGFERQVQLLFKILSGVRGSVAPHLAQLLLRFDFNQYFSMTKTNVLMHASMQGSLSTISHVSATGHSAVVHGNSSSITSSTSNSSSTTTR
jgi:gamma-tubulin complex component 4